MQLLSCSPSLWSPYAPNTIAHDHCLVCHQQALFTEHCGIFLSLTQDLGPRTLSKVLSQSRLGHLNFAFKLYSVSAFFFVRWSMCKTPHTPVLLHLSQAIALQGKEQTKFQFIPSLGHWFPNIFLIYHDLGEFVLTAILITFVLLPALPLTEEALLLSLMSIKCYFTRPAVFQLWLVPWDRASFVMPDFPAASWIWWEGSGSQSWDFTAVVWLTSYQFIQKWAHSNS